MKTHIIFTALVLSFVSLTLTAQQIPMYTHYMDNTLVVNPAYAGSRDALTVTAINRAQWVDFKGSPLTQSITMHAPLLNEHIGLGFSLMNDKIGPSNNTSVVFDYAFIMNLSSKSKLALGLSAGVNIFQADLSLLQLDVQNDPVFLNNINNHVTPNVGFGAYYSTERFYAGFSIPNLFENSYSEILQPNGFTLIGKEQRHYFLIAGSMIKLTENIEFKPTTYLKITSAAPIEADLTASFVIQKRFLVGAMVRTGDALGALVGFDVTDQFHIGYSFDWSYGLQTFRYNQGSHEIVLRYDFIFLNRKQIHSPRNF
ncbi:MAG: type IX secretion system membrane protein PorP/SprF [Paludibacter sp.]